MKRYKRRCVLAITGATVGSVSGCTGLPFSPSSSDRYIPGGSVVFSNQTEKSHPLTVKIRHVATGGNAIPENQNKTPEQPPDGDVREPLLRTYQAEPKSEIVDESIVDEPGSYYMRGTLSDGRHADVWYEYNERLYVLFSADGTYGLTAGRAGNYD